eukprot:148862_1
MLSVEQSAQKTEIERKKYNAALREAMEYKRLNKELHQINEQYNQKNALLYECETEHNENVKQVRWGYPEETHIYIVVMSVYYMSLKREEHEQWEKNISFKMIKSFSIN